MFVGAIVVENEMHGEVGRHAGLDVAEKGEKLLMPVASLALREHFAGLNVQRGEERRGAMARVVVGDALHVAQAERQIGLGPLQRLNLALLVDAEHQGVVGGIEIGSHDVTHLLHEERVGGELKLRVRCGCTPKRVK